MLSYCRKKKVAEKSAFVVIPDMAIILVVVAVLKVKIVRKQVMVVISLPDWTGHWQRFETLEY